MTTPKSKFTLTSAPSAVIKNEYFYDMSLEVYMKLAEPKLTDIYMKESSGMYWLLNMPGDISSACTKIGTKTVLSKSTLAGTKHIKSTYACPLNSNTY